MIRGIIYRDVESNKHGFLSTVFVFRWIPVSQENENGSDDRAHLSEHSQLDLESILANDECSEVGLEEIPDDADEFPASKVHLQPIRNWVWSKGEIHPFQGERGGGGTSKK